MRLERLGKVAVVIDASKIIRGLYQGSAPPSSEAVRAAGFDTLVLCARELIPDQVRRMRGRVNGGDLDVFVCRLNDATLTPQELALAEDVATRVTDAVLMGRKVLVTCQMGLNRSGLVTALALQKVSGCSGVACVAHIRKCRPPQATPDGYLIAPLSNQSFVDAIESIPAQRQVVS